jgi:hypothetical protein
VVRLARIAALLSLAALVLPLAAHAESCVSASVKDKLAGADVAFVGRVVSQRPVPRANGLPQFDYTFGVSHAVKGAPSGRVTVRAARLVDLSGTELTPTFDEDVGVLARRVAGGKLVASSCSLVDAVTLLDESDHPKGGLIKVAIGLVLLVLVLGFSVRRLKRRGGAPRPNPLG